MIVANKENINKPYINPQLSQENNAAINIKPYTINYNSLKVNDAQYYYKLSYSIEKSLYKEYNINIDFDAFYKNILYNYTISTLNYKSNDAIQTNILSSFSIYSNYTNHVKGDKLTEADKKINEMQISNVTINNPIKYLNHFSNKNWLYNILGASSYILAKDITSLFTKFGSDLKDTLSLLSANTYLEKDVVESYDWLNYPPGMHVNNLNYMNFSKDSFITKEATAVNKENFDKFLKSYSDSLEIQGFSNDKAAIEKQWKKDHIKIIEAPKIAYTHKEFAHEKGLNIITQKTYLTDKLASKPIIADEWRAEITQAPLLKKNIDDSNSNSNSIFKKNITKSYKTNIEKMLISGPDWMSNKFDIFFYWGNINDFEKSNIALTKLSAKQVATPEEHSILTEEGFAVRVGKVVIPSYVNKEYTIPIMETVVHKIGSSKVMNNESSFTIRLDSDLIWLSAIQRLSGRNLDTLSRNSTYLSNTWTSLKESMGLIKLNIIVKMTQLIEPIDGSSLVRALPYYVFENVKILGTSDKISYKSNPGQQEITVPFIFKRLYKVHINNSKYTNKSINYKQPREYIPNENYIKPKVEPKVEPSVLL